MKKKRVSTTPQSPTRQKEYEKRAKRVVIETLNNVNTHFQYCTSQPAWVEGLMLFRPRIQLKIRKWLNKHESGESQPKTLTSAADDWECLLSKLRSGIVYPATYIVFEKAVEWRLHLWSRFLLKIYNNYCGYTWWNESFFSCCNIKWIKIKGQTKSCNKHSCMWMKQTRKLD